MNENSAKVWGNVAAGGTILVLAGAVLLFNLHWIDKLSAKPTPVSAEQLLALAEGKEPPSRWVTYRATGDAVETDLQLTKLSVVVAAKYVLVPVGRKVMIAEVEPAHAGSTFTGVVGA